MPNILKPFIYTRSDYLKSSIDHQTYYRQLVKPALVEFVKDVFTTKWLSDTRNDGHFNHIPLQKWDNAAATASVNGFLPNKFEWDMVEDFPTQAGLVSILKTAARMAVEQEQQ